MILTPNEYLDRRRPEWTDAEILGRVRYDPKTQTIAIDDRVIARAIDARQTF